MSLRFKGKNVLITGAGSGIGRATAILFATEGARVVAVDMTDEFDTAEMHPGVASLRGDAGSESDVSTMMKLAAQRHGAIDIVVANAGISGGTAGLFEQGEADWAELLRINLIGAFLAVKHGAKAMLTAGKAGAIICTASVAGLRSGAGGPAYSASKAGILNLVQTAAQQLTGSGIRVNAVCPGLIETGMTRSLYEAARAKGRANQIGRLNPLQRGGEPVEIARAIAYLASEEASYVNGHALVIDGGLSTSHPIGQPSRLGVSTF